MVICELYDNLTFSTQIITSRIWSSNTQLKTYMTSPIRLNKCSHGKQVNYTITEIIVCNTKMGATI